MELIRKMKMFYEQSFVLAVFLIASTDAIVGGIPSRRDQFPFFVYLQGETTDLTYECGSVLIDPSWILTSAHCLKPATEQVVLYFGLNEISHLELGRTKRTILPDNFFLHPLFEADSLKNDIALIRLPVPVKLNVYIQPIEISSHQSAYRPFAGIVIGNGEREYKGKRSNITHYAPMRGTNIFDCLKAFPHLTNRSTVFCAAGENGESVCYGKR